MEDSSNPVPALIRSKGHCRPPPSFSNEANSLRPQNRTKPTLWSPMPWGTPWTLRLPRCLVPSLLYPSPGTPRSSLPLTSRLPCALPWLGGRSSDLWKWRVILPVSSKALAQSLCASGLHNWSRVTEHIERIQSRARKTVQFISKG